MPQNLLSWKVILGSAQSLVQTGSPNGPGGTSQPCTTSHGTLTWTTSATMALPGLQTPLNLASAPWERVHTDICGPRRSHDRTRTAHGQHHLASQARGLRCPATQPNRAPSTGQAPNRAGPRSPRPRRQQRAMLQRYLRSQSTDMVSGSTDARMLVGVAGADASKGRQLLWSAAVFLRLTHVRKGSCIAEEHRFGSDGGISNRPSRSALLFAYACVAVCASRVRVRAHQSFAA